MKIKPFKAIRPTRDKVHLVASRPYYTYEKQVLDAKLENNPYTFIHIINPEFSSIDKPSLNSIERFEKVRKRYEKFCQDNIFMQDITPSFYIYRQTFDNHSFTGLIAGASVDEYNDGKIKKHEETITARESLFVDYLDSVGFNAEPVLLSYPKNDNIAKLIASKIQQLPEYDFTTTDGNKHELWVCNNNDLIKDIQSQFDQINDVYIADGHHRSASSARLAEIKRKQNPHFTGEENFNSFLAYFISEDEMKIYDFNRLVLDLNGFTSSEFLECVREKFDLNIMEESKIKRREHFVHMFFEDTWYEIEMNPSSINTKSPVESLDSYLLTKGILEPILAIDDLKTSERIRFINGQFGLEGIRKEVMAGKAKVGFALAPLTATHIKNVADANEIMPPKSTWVEPKLRSGLTIYNIEG
jgi:uncharacterized protein (DUF1015 family)